jgi:hypothetical protein
LLKTRQKIKKDVAIKEQVRPNQQREGERERGQITISGFPEFPGNGTVTDHLIKFTIGPIRATGKFLTNRGEIALSSATDNSVWAQFHRLSFRLVSAGKSSIGRKSDPLCAETETAYAIFWIWQLKRQSPGTALRQSRRKKLNRLHTDCSMDFARGLRRPLYFLQTDSGVFENPRLDSEGMTQILRKAREPSDCFPFPMTQIRVISDVYFMIHRSLSLNRIVRVLIPRPRLPRPSIPPRRPHKAAI